jgi:hypothetical protein
MLSFLCFCANINSQALLFCLLECLKFFLTFKLFEISLPLRDVGFLASDHPKWQTRWQMLLGMFSFLCLCANIGSWALHPSVCSNTSNTSQLWAIPNEYCFTHVRFPACECSKGLRYMPCAFSAPEHISSPEHQSSICSNIRNLSRCLSTSSWISHISYLVSGLQCSNSTNHITCLSSLLLY